MLPLSGKSIGVARFSRRRLVFAVAGMFLCQLAASAQVHKRSVRGRVTDQAGTPLKGAIVRIKNTWSLRVRSYIVLGDGVYRFRGLVPGVDYELKAKFQGVASGKKRLDRFDSRAEAVVDLTIHLPGSRS